jgi:flavin reductase (DIM6/NTAB) family NADH-FMN oxidoreductase RutF
MGLTAAPGVKVACPHVAESPMSIECRVKSIVPLGTHHMFIAEVLSVLADEQYLDPTTGAFDMERAGLIAYAHGGYYTLGEKLGKFGFSVQKKNNKH